MPAARATKQKIWVGRLSLSSRGRRLSWAKMSAAGIRYGPYTFGSLNSPRARSKILGEQQVRVRERDEQRERGGDGDQHRAGDVGLDHQPRALLGVHVAADPEPDRDAVDRHREVARGDVGLQRLHARQQVQRDEQRAQREHRERHAPQLEPVRDGGDRDHDRQHRVHGRRFRAHDRQQQDAERDRGVVAEDREREHGDDADAARRHVHRRNRVAAQLEPERRAEQEQQHQAGDVIERPVEACGALVLAPRSGDAAHSVRLDVDGRRRVPHKVASRPTRLPVPPGKRWRRSARSRSTSCSPASSASEDYGTFVFALTLTGTLLIGAGFGTDELIAREVARNRARAGRYLSDVAGLKATTSVVLLSIAMARRVRGRLRRRRAAGDAAGGPGRVGRGDGALVERDLPGVRAAGARLGDADHPAGPHRDPRHRRADRGRRARGGGRGLPHRGGGRVRGHGVHVAALHARDARAPVPGRRLERCCAAASRSGPRRRCGWCC